MTTTVQNYLDKGLRGLWYPVLASWEVQSAPVGITRLGEQIVVWRNKDGQVQALEDRCPHRGARLSMGWNLGDRIACWYHGVEVAGNGEVKDVPAVDRCPLVGQQCVRSYSVHEAHGAIFLWFGVTADQLPEQLPEDIDGFHCHCHCESGSDVFERTLAHIEEKFAKWFPQLKWINFGGGHLMTRADYDVERLVNLLQGFRCRYPWLKVVLEPGSAFAWQTGPLVSQVVDIVENRGIRTAILNVSFTCHMPDCLEMPYMPAVRGAETVEDVSGAVSSDAENSSLSPYYIYRLGGNSCLSGDFMGSWRFDHELQIGENVIFEDMIHYTTVKTNTFNGISHPAIAMVHEGTDQLEVLRRFSPDDYLSRMD